MAAPGIGEIWRMLRSSVVVKCTQRGVGIGKQTVRIGNKGEPREEYIAERLTTIYYAIIAGVNMTVRNIK